MQVATLLSLPARPVSYTHSNMFSASQGKNLFSRVFEASMMVNPGTKPATVVVMHCEWHSNSDHQALTHLMHTAALNVSNCIVLDKEGGGGGGGAGGQEG